MTPWRDHFAHRLGVSPERKLEIYRDVARSASLRDAVYWLQILFAAAIATLGLVLDSAAVIIGAMLISPLMGPILASGLALAAGDLVLGARALLNVLLSCVLAVGVAALLVAALPFNDMTAEIAARTQPTTLDLAVALCSGAVGSVAVAREVRGVVTSIPGVAIAVALMPPLCVVGYGVGVALTLSGPVGVRVALGGGLLFLTNLTAITFTAMVVFLLLHVDIPQVKARITELRGDVGDSWLRRQLRRLPLSPGLREIGSLPGRFLLVGLPLLVILVPLADAYTRLREQIVRQQTENRIRRTASQLWHENFETLPTGEPRSYIDSLAITEHGGRLTLYLRVFTSKLYVPDEREAFVRLLATRLQRPLGVIGLQLVEVPTASGEVAAQASRPRRPEAPPTVAELQAGFHERVDVALAGLRLPPIAERVGHRVTSSAAAPLQVELAYLAERDMGPDAQALVVENVRALLDVPEAAVRLERIAPDAASVRFDRDDATLPPSAEDDVEEVAALLARFPTLGAEIVAHAEPGERDGVAVERAQVVRDFIAARTRIAPGRLTAIVGADAGREARLRLSAPSPRQLP